ncbi:hypothetical protein V1522DRAFT_415500 [Lipomyces starkeyi]
MYQFEMPFSNSLYYHTIQTCDYMRHTNQVSNDDFQLQPRRSNSRSYGTVANIVEYALVKAGYRHIDAAFAYDNGAEVGQGIAGAIVSRAQTRADIFVTTKGLVYFPFPCCGVA